MMVTQARILGYCGKISQTVRRAADSTRRQFVYLGMIGVLCVGHQAHGQEFSDLQLENPILPGAVVNPSGVAQPYGGTAPMAAPPISHPLGTLQQPIGSAVAYRDGQVAQASWTGCDACGSVGCTGCGVNQSGYGCPPSGVGVWVRADYLAWYEKGNELMPLATTSSGLPADPEGLLALGTAETRVVFGNQTVDDNPLEGLRIEIGSWLNASQTLGIYGRYFNVGDRSNSFAASSTDFNFLGIPFFNTDPGAEDALDLTVPGERQGNLNINLTGDVSGWEIMLRRLAQTGPNYRIDWIYGYRNFNLSERLSLNANSVSIAANEPATLFSTTDTFRFDNELHAFDFGITGHSYEGRWSLDFLAKVALGFVDQEIEINGSQLNTIPGTDTNGDGFPDTNAVTSRNIGGLFSQESNLGKHDESEFTWSPEFNVNLGYALTGNLDFTVGYTFIYIADVVRAGSSIDRTVDSGLLFDLEPVNQNRPQELFDQSSYYIHGLNLGLTGRF